MALLALGLNHQTAPLALRERLAFAPDDQHEALEDLLRLPGVEEAALLSTCNRTEVYLGGEAAAAGAVPDWLARQREVSASDLQAYLYRHDDAEAVRHLFRVATGLDSLVLGEPQILGQVKEAYQRARGAGTLRPALERLFQHSFAVAKRVRTDTRIGAHPVSVAFAAVRLARQVFAELEKATVLLIGAGETIELAARHLVEARARRVLVANRTLEHAQQLASRCGGYALPLDELERHLPEADIVISATAARHVVVDASLVRRALAVRRHQPMFMLDLAVPRDIDPAVSELEDVYLYTVDDLEKVIEDNRRFRQQAARQAEDIIDLQVGHFMAWWQGSFRQDALRRLRRGGETTRDQVLERAARMLAQGRDPDEALRFLAHTLTNKLLHAPSAALREASMRGDAELLRAAERLYADLDKDDDESGPAPQA